MADKPLPFYESEGLEGLKSALIFALSPRGQAALTHPQAMADTELQGLLSQCALVVWVPVDKELPQGDAGETFFIQIEGGGMHWAMHSPGQPADVWEDDETYYFNVTHWARIRRPQR